MIVPAESDRGVSWWLDGHLLAPVRNIGGAVVVAAGPWLVAVGVLALVSVTMKPVLGAAAIEDVRLTVVYAFCIAPLAAGPIGAVLGRLVVIDIESGQFGQVPALFLTAGVIAAATSQCVAVLIALGLGLENVALGSAFSCLVAAAALLWTSFAVLTALRAYRFLIMVFSGSMAISVACIMLAAGGTATTERLIWSLSAGIGLCVWLSIARVQRAAGDAAGGFPAALARLVSAIWWHRPLVAGVFLAICAVWVDKWIYWLGPDGMRSKAGYLHYSPYDSVMFVSHLAVIPSYAALHIFNDSDLKAAVADFRASLRHRATFAAMRASVDRLVHGVWSGVLMIVFVQGAFTVCMVLMAPPLARTLQFGFDQFLMLRVGLIAVFLHAFFSLNCAVLLVCNRARVFALLQCGLFLSNLLTGLVFFAFVGVSSYGFFTSSLIMAMIAFYVAYRDLNRFDFLTFVAENDPLYEA